MSAYLRILHLLITITIVIVIGSCNFKSKPRPYVIAFSQCTIGPWRETMLEGMKRELSFQPGTQLIYRQAEGNTEKQVSQVKDLLQQDPDILLISPNEAEALTPVVEEAFKKQIPVIIIDRKITSSLYTAYVGGNNYEVGKMAGEYAVNLLKGKGNVVEITILPGSSNAAERHQGFADAISKHPSIHLIKQINGELLKSKNQDSVYAEINLDLKIDLIFAQNDYLASKIYDFWRRKGLGDLPKIIGVDGLSGKGEGLQLVSDKIITATMLYPTGGEEAIQTAMKVLKNEDFKRDNNLQTTIIDSSNVRYMQLASDKVISQEHAIERQHNMLAQQQKIYRSQQTSLYIVACLLALSVALGGFLLYSLQLNRKINRKLRLQNIEISEQKAQLLEVSAQAQVANEAKVNFFTNISHEFRTPLTLILGPLEELQATVKNHQGQARYLNLIHKNVIRLLRLVNQLIDFRKIEVDKMRLRASENNIVTFVSEIMQSYETPANKRNIDFRLITNESQIKAWFDVNMLDKVIFNLLSNAFKFTKDNGSIHVYISRGPDEKEVVIKVEDNGIGMAEDVSKNIFGIFYQGEYENHKGSGLGLALSKELIKLHKGSVTVKSEKGTGTSFEVRLPLGSEHLEKQDLVENTITPFVFYENEKVYTTDLEVKQVQQTEVEGLNKEKEYSILIIEDNADLRGFLKNRLSYQYEVLEAEDGHDGLEQSFNIVPDLIVLDVVIPEKDGLALLHIFKTDIRTSHIPVILLTGRASIEHQIEGMKNMADAYITKPFSIHLFEQTIKSLLSNRAMLKEHFTSELPSNLKPHSIGKIDRKFVNEFTSLIKSNIANDELSVEEICKTMGISRVQLYRKVKALMNVNVNDYILNIRLQKAKYLLQHEELSISEISYKVGFSSPAYFSTVFKSKFGVTPKSFKEQ